MSDLSYYQPRAGRLVLVADQVFEEPLTRAEVEHFLGLAALSPADSERDALLDDLIRQARVDAEVGQGYDLVEKQWDYYLDALPAWICELRAPLVSVDSVTYKDSDGVTHTLTVDVDYIVDSAYPAILPPYGDTWPSYTAWPVSGVVIRYTSGYAADDVFWTDWGARIKNLMKNRVSELFNARLPFQVADNARLDRLLEAGGIPRVK